MNITNSPNYVEICDKHHPDYDPKHIDCMILDLRKYGGAVILATGTIGHILSLLVILTKKSFRIQTFGVYIVALSLAGLLTLYTGVLHWTIQGFTMWQFNIRQHLKMGCIFHVMLTYTSLQYVAWIQATIALDRMYHVARHFWKSKHCGSHHLNWKKGLIIVSVELLVCLGLNSFVVLVLDYENECFYLPVPSAWFIWSVFDLISFSILPSVIIIISNVVVIIATRRSLNNTKSEHKNKTLVKTRRSMTVMLTVVNILFVVTTLPVSIVQLMDNDNPKTELVRSACYAIQYLGVANTFVVYCISGSKFRSALGEWKIFRCFRSGQQAAKGVNSSVKLYNSSTSLRKTSRTLVTTTLMYNENHE